MEYAIYLPEQLGKLLPSLKQDPPLIIHAHLAGSLAAHEPLILAHDAHSGDGGVEDLHDGAGGVGADLVGDVVREEGEACELGVSRSIAEVEQR